MNMLRLYKTEEQNEALSWGWRIIKVEKLH